MEQNMLRISPIEKILIGTGLVENLATTVLGLTTNVDTKYLTALIATSVVSVGIAGASISYGAIKQYIKNE